MRLFGRRCDILVHDLRVTGLRVSFAIKRTLRSLPNAAEVKVYNLSRDSRARIESVADEGSVRVQILAGYGDEVFNIFTGDLKDAQSTRDGADVITAVSGVDGGHAHRTSRVSRSFSPGAAVSTVLGFLADSIGVDIGNAVEAFAGSALGDSGRTFPSGTTVNGSAAEELDALCRSAGLEYSIQDNRLQVLTIGRAVPGQAVRLSPETGLVGSPTEGNRGVVSGQCKIIPDVQPGRLIQLDAEFIQGVYRLDSCEYVGDTHGSDWDIKFEARRPRTSGD